MSMLGASCSPCCGCPCTTDTYNRLAASTVTLTLSSPIPNAIALTSGPARISTVRRFSAPADPVPNGTYTFQKASNFYQTYTMAFDPEYSGYTCYRSPSGIVNSAQITLGYVNDEVSIGMQMILSVRGEGQPPPKYLNQPMQQIAGGRCYFAALFSGVLYVNSASISGADLPPGLDWQKTAYTQGEFYYKTWNITPSARALCSNSGFATGYWDSDYAPAGAAYSQSPHVYINYYGPPVTMQSVALADGFPSGVEFEVAADRVFGSPSLFFTADRTKAVPCSAGGGVTGSFETAEVLGSDSAASTVSASVTITPAS